MFNNVFSYHGCSSEQVVMSKTSDIAKHYRKLHDLPSSEQTTFLPFSHYVAPDLSHSIAYILLNFVCLTVDRQIHMLHSIGLNNIILQAVFHAQQQDLPQLKHFFAGAQWGFVRSSCLLVGLSFQDMRYLTIVRLVNSVLHPPHLQIVLSDQHLCDAKYWQSLQWKEWVPYGDGSMFTSSKLLQNISKNVSEVYVNQAEHTIKMGGSTSSPLAFLSLCHSHPSGETGSQF